MTLDDTTDTSYVVSDVFKINEKINANKWHMSLVYDNPSWPIIEREAEKYCLIVRVG